MRCVLLVALLTHAAAYECSDYYTCQTCGPMAGCVWASNQCIDSSSATTLQVSSSMACTCLSYNTCGNAGSGCMSKAYCGWCPSSGCYGNDNANEDRCWGGGWETFSCGSSSSSSCSSSTPSFMSSYDDYSPSYWSASSPPSPSSYGTNTNTNNNNYNNNNYNNGNTGSSACVKVLGIWYGNCTTYTGYIVGAACFFLALTFFTSMMHVRRRRLMLLANQTPTIVQVATPPGGAGGAVAVAQPIVAAAQPPVYAATGNYGAQAMAMPQAVAYPGQAGVQMNVGYAT